MRVAIPQLERLRSRGQLDHDARTNEALFAAGDRLRRHHEGAGTGPRCFDPTRIAAGQRAYEPSEARLRHVEQYRCALAMLGGTESTCAKVVKAIVLDDWTVEATAKAFFGSRRAALIKAETKDGLRRGLFTLAVHWGMT